MNARQDNTIRFAKSIGIDPGKAQHLSYDRLLELAVLAYWTKRARRQDREAA